MPVGPYANVKTVYTLTWPTFSVKAHLKLLSEQASLAAGLDVERQNLEALCANPKEGNPGILHDSVASITPSFMGLQGSFRVQARPESRLLPVVKAIGLKLWGEFDESASSASSELTEVWTRRRFVPNGERTLTGGPAGAYQSETVMLKFTRESGDEYDDFSPVQGDVIAQAGTLQPGDLLISPIHGTFQVRGVFIDGDYEKGRLER